MTSGGVQIGAEVFVYRDGKRVLSKNAEGAFSFGGLFKGSYAVCVKTPVPYRPTCSPNIPWSGAAPPAGSQVVSVNPGSITSADVLVPRPPRTAIAGTVKNTAGQGLAGIGVWLLNRSTGVVFSAESGVAGAYKIGGLSPSAKGYTVCAASGIGDEVPTVAWAGRCYQDVAWPAANLAKLTRADFPTTATAVSVTTGQTHSGVVLKLRPAGNITGSVVDADANTPLQFAAVRLYDKSAGFITDALVDGVGNYRFGGVPAGKYYVCYRAGDGPAGRSFAGQCWNGVAWNGAALPAGADLVSAFPTATTPDIDFSLHAIPRGSIHGFINDVAGYLRYASVYVITPAGKVVGQALTGTRDFFGGGEYLIENLPYSSTGYFVCVDPRQASNDVMDPDGRWGPRCYGGKPWDGAPADVPQTATPVPVTAVQPDRTGISILDVPLGGMIAGTVLRFGTATPARVNVLLLSQSSRLLDSTLTDANGAYRFSGIVAEINYAVCFEGRTFADVPQGYLPQCYKAGGNVPWDGTYTGGP